jgi:hypothetical protein
MPPERRVVLTAVPNPRRWQLVPAVAFVVTTVFVSILPALRERYGDLQLLRLER